MEDLTEYFMQILKQSGSVDMAEADFRQSLIDNPDLRRQYKDYCQETDTSEKRGFRDFCEEYVSESNTVWQHLSDYDD